MGRQPFLSECLLVALGVCSRHEEKHDLARRCLARVDQFPDATGDVTRLRGTPVRLSLTVGRLVGDEELDPGAEQRFGKPAGCDQRLEVRTELGAEEVVDDAQHLGP
jgi:hypothetical protein